MPIWCQFQLLFLHLEHQQESVTVKQAEHTESTPVLTGKNVYLFNFFFLLSVEIVSAISGWWLSEISSCQRVGADFDSKFSKIGTIQSRLIREWILRCLTTTNLTKTCFLFH